jgi:hypothetical protein
MATPVEDLSMVNARLHHKGTKMLKLFLLIFLVLPSGTPAKLKMETPECVQAFVDNYLQSDHAKGILERLRISLKTYWSVPLLEIDVGFPVKLYRINYAILDTCSPDSDVEKLIIPSGLWIFPVYHDNKVFYQITIQLKNGVCSIYSVASIVNLIPPNTARFLIISAK